MSTTTQADTTMRNAVLALASAAALWGSSFLFGKLALRELSAAHVVLARFVLGSALLVPIAWRWFPDVSGEREDVPRFLFAAVMMVPVSFLLQFEGLDLTTAARASLIIGAAPPIMAVASSLYGRDRLQRREWLAVLASTVGVVLMVGVPGTGGNAWGDLMVLASIATLTIWSLTTKDLMNRYPPLFTTAASMGLGTLFMIPAAFLRSGVPDLSLPLGTWGALVALGAGCTALTYALWNWGMRHVGVARSGVFLNIEPVVGALLGVLLLNDVLGPWTVAGGLMILTSTYVVSRGT